MVTAWTSSKEVVSRIMRNIRGVEADYKDSIPEWIGEAVRQLKTKYSLQTNHTTVYLNYHSAPLKLRSESILYVLCGGHKLGYYTGREVMGEEYAVKDTYLAQLFKSDTPVYTTEGALMPNLDTYTGGNPFTRDVITSLADMPCLEGHWWKLSGNTLQSSIRDGKVTVVYMAIPMDEDNFPIIPDVENYMEALYWYNRMKLIEAGFEDKIFNHGMAKKHWEEYQIKAIADITYPTVAQMDEQIQRHLNLFPHEYHWGAGMINDYGI